MKTTIFFTEKKQFLAIINGEPALVGDFESAAKFESQQDAEYCLNSHEIENYNFGSYEIQ